MNCGFPLLSLTPSFCLQLWRCESSSSVENSASPTAGCSAWPFFFFIYRFVTSQRWKLLMIVGNGQELKSGSGTAVLGRERRTLQSWGYFPETLWTGCTRRQGCLGSILAFPLTLYVTLDTSVTFLTGPHFSLLEAGGWGRVP